MFIIIKYFERLSLNVPGVPDAWPQWAKVSVVTVKENYKPVERIRINRIERNDALRLIREHGLVLAESTNDGKVWDTTERDFQKRYKGTPVHCVI